MQINSQENKDLDVPDLGITRKSAEPKAKQADILDNFIATIAIVSYIGDIVTDCLVAYYYYIDRKYAWFALTTFFIVVPSIIMQSLSSKWYYDDNNHQKWWSVVLHIFQLGPVERYCIAFWCGLKTLCTSKGQKENFDKYLSNWRDVTLLRLIEAFAESAPQVVLQLYILLKVYPNIKWNDDWITITAAILSIISLAWSIVSYSHALRISTRGNGYSFCGYFFQVAYRLFMVASRVVALVLFASQYNWIVFVVCFIHWALMVSWLHCHKTDFCSSNNNCIQKWLNSLFIVLMGFVHIFCFINTCEGTSRQRVSCYYALIFIENSAMIAAWYPFRKGEFGILEYGALSFVWGGFLLGVLCMLTFYKLFHPTQGIIEGWLCCTMCATNEVNESVPANSSQTQEPTPVYIRHKFIQKSEKYIPVDIELSARSDLSSLSNKSVKHKPPTDLIETQQVILDPSDDQAPTTVSVAKSKNYGSLVSIPSLVLDDILYTEFV